MIRVSSHEEFQNAVFDKPSFGQLKYEAIPSNTFTVAMLKRILNAFRNTQVENSPNQILDLMHAIQNAAERNNWHFSNQYFLVVSQGRGHLLQEIMAKSKTKSTEEQQEMANTLIQKHQRILIIIDTDVNLQTTKNESDPSLNEKLGILTEAVEKLGTDLTEIQNDTKFQKGILLEQEAAYNRFREEYSALQDQLDTGRRTLTPPDSDEEISSIQCYQNSPFLDDKTCSKRKPKRRKPLEQPPSQDGTEFPVWRKLSSEENQMERESVQRPRRYKAWTLKMLNIQKYDPEQMDIITHVERVTRILKEVNVKPESQKIRLLVASLPSSMDHYEKAVPNRHRHDYTRFSRELVKIMGNKVRVASQRFMQCHRKRGEDILRFFFRLCDLYKSSKGLMGDEWHLNPIHVSHIYSLLYHGLYNEEQLRLDEKLDKQLERGILTVARLKKELIEINKMASNKVRGEIPTSKAIMTVEAIKNKEQEDDYEETHALSSGESAEDESTYWEN